MEWVEALIALRRDVANPRIYPFREHVARACERAAPGSVSPISSALFWAGARARCCATSLYRG